MAVVLLSLTRPGLGADAPIDTVAQAAGRIDAQLEENVSLPGRDKDAVLKAQESLFAMLDVLEQKSVMLIGERKKRWEAIDRQLRLSLQEWVRATGAGEPVQGRAAQKVIRNAWAAMKLQYPPEALEILPALWSCPMHSELLEREAGTCPVCGMSLDPVYVTQPQLTRDPIIRSEVTVSAPLVVGRQAAVRFRLIFDKDNRPVTLEDLEEIHTQKIHLLIIDASETDYHHEHPQTVGKGEYTCSFTPSKPGVYRVWADLKPALTHVQQYSIADIPAAAAGHTRLIEEPENRQSEIEGFKFELHFEEAPIQAKATVRGSLYVTNPDGRPCRDLEVVMGAFGHFVGFRDNFSTVLHMHPVGPPLEQPNSFGGPDLPFYFRSDAPGTVRLFTQVKINGKNLFPRFVVKVQPLQHLPKG